MVNIVRNIVPRDVASRVTYNGTNTKRYIVIHETDNTKPGADADAHGILQYNGNSREASWHYSVDDKEIVQSFEDSTQCWAAGNSYYNKHGIQIEICVNSDGNYLKAVANTVALVQHLMKKYNIPISRVIQHHDASLKNCPRYLRAGSKGATWAGFISQIKGSKPSVKEPPKQNSVSEPKYLVDWMKYNNMDSSYSNRAKLAARYGIKNYRGTAAQNTKLLSLLKSNSKPAPKPNMSTNSIVEYLESIGQDSSYRNRSALAKKHGISNYKGTASQNLRLLSILREGYFYVPRDTPAYATAADAKAKRNRKGTVKKGNYHVFNTSIGMYNVTKKKGTPGSWINLN